jgi:hypothetical protein
MNITKHLAYLGHRVKDKVTGIEGVVTSVSFDLFGCIMATVNRGVDKEGKAIESQWFDIARLAIIDNVPVMKRPDFEWTPQAVAAGEKGPAEKPRSDRF